MVSSLFLEMLNRELLWRFSFLMSGATQFIGLVSGVTGGVLFPVALVLLVGLLLLLLLLVFVFDVKACKENEERVGEGLLFARHESITGWGWFVSDYRY